MPKPRFSYEEFAIAWKASDSINEVCERLGVSRQTVEKTGTQMRRAGVKLKPMRSNLPARGEIDVAALNALMGASGDDDDDADEAVGAQGGDLTEQPSA